MAQLGQGGQIDAKALYYTLIDQLGLEATDSEGNKLRQHPRFSFDSPERTILVEIEEISCALKDVSVGGLSFYSTVNLDIGRRLQLNFDRMFLVTAQVVRVVQEKKEEGDSIYLHGCKFANENDGYSCTVLVLELLISIMRQKDVTGG